MSQHYDVIVVGGGNAALCAALSAREAGSRVLVLERSPENERGGNTRHTRNIRCTHAAADQFFSGPYSEEEHLQDLIGVTGGPANLDLAKLAVRESSHLPAWMSSHGVHWQQPLAGTLHLACIAALFLTAPYGKFVHAVYRTLAVIRYEIEQEQPHQHVGH
jgi:tricarballylate dehydrogenase